MDVPWLAIYCCISKPVKGGHSTNVSFQGGARAPGAPPLPPPMGIIKKFIPMKINKI